MAPQHVEPLYSDHPLSHIFPLCAGQPLEDLADHIKTHGLLEEIVLLNNKILDGRRRYLACLKMGTTPHFRHFGSRTTDGDDPLTFVFGQNFHRRHLNSKELISSKSQFAIMAVKTQKHSQTQTDSANLHKVSRSSVQRVKTVMDQGCAPLQTALETGTVSIRDASLTARQDPAIQIKAVEMVQTGKAPTLSAAIKTIIPNQSSEEANKNPGSIVLKAILTLQTLVRQLDRLGMYNDETKTFLTKLAARLQE